MPTLNLADDIREAPAILSEVLADQRARMQVLGASLLGTLFMQRPSCDTESLFVVTPHSNALMPPGGLEHDIHSLLSTTLSNRVAAYFELASICVLVYDYFLTLELEIGLVWHTPWNMGKILFFLTRYLVFIDSSLLGYFHLSGGGADSVTTCRILYQISGWMIFVGVAIAEFVLVFRTWAIWGKSRNVAIALLVVLFGLGIPSMYLTKRGMDSVRYMQSPIPQVQRCFMVEVNDRIMFLDYLVILIIETVILIFTLIKGVQHYRHSESTLVSTLYKDGLLYYLYLTGCSIVNVCVLAFPEKTHGATLILLERVLHSIFTARILLHLRLAAVRDRLDASTNSTPPVLTSLIYYSSEGQLTTNIILGTDTWLGSDVSKSRKSDIESVSPW